MRKIKTIPPRTEIKQEREVKQCKERLHMLEEDGYDILFVDETMFTKNTIYDRAWSRKNEPFEYDLKQVSSGAVACLAAISMNHGVDHFQMFDKSVD